jgi:hypothetical protein
MVFMVSRVEIVASGVDSRLVTRVRKFFRSFAESWSRWVIILSEEGSFYVRSTERERIGPAAVLRVRKLYFVELGVN